MVARIYDGEDMRRQFEAYDRDYYSDDAYDALVAYYDEIDPDYELDVIEICESWTEYDDAKEVAKDYDFVLTAEDWLRDEYEEYADADEDEIAMALEDDELMEDYYYALMDELENDTVVIALSHGDYLVEAF